MVKIYCPVCKWIFHLPVCIDCLHVECLSCKTELEFKEEPA